MIVHFPTKQDGCELLVDGAATVFSYAPNGIKAKITPWEHKISKWAGRQGESDSVRAYHFSGGFTELYKPLGLSLPSNDDFNSFAAHWYNIAKPFVWHRNEGAGFVVGGAVR
ncbi:hypothetical protein SCLCIDRAFT_241216 [Scleroderma citrinum Foug A]|uniref:Uncharacterized protein n=1 Tax=Scleroderma citrinum Foug A TaxID=1036808 RepID=A0A0C3DKC6_9AGAM|nr:hypothetical protein SCLCIDRAFT_241216 [Scleroderma citrinum Foug A]